MTKVNSLAELTQLRDKLKTEADNGNAVKVLVGMATCGIAAGAKDTLAAITDEVNAQGLNGVTVSSCGCVGMCFVEPTVEVFEKGKESVMYGNVSPDKAREIVKKHLKNGEVVQGLQVQKSY